MHNCSSYTLFSVVKLILESGAYIATAPFYLAQLVDIIQYPVS